jgi:hypothetical protein
MLAAAAGATPRIAEGGAHPNGAICRTLVQASVANVGFGSISAAPSRGTRGCFTPQGCRADRSLSGQLRARSGLMHCNMIAETEPDYQHLYPSHPVPGRR